jgi:uncharacterized membrane protein
VKLKRNCANCVYVEFGILIIKRVWVVFIRGEESIGELCGAHKNVDSWSIYADVVSYEWVGPLNVCIRF